mmetsp:Transcript_89495/g.261569  ORF Transcript_89495/g.261569 Transcript_89495/m.261569 type:complete len:278 (-) Transcript_89495:90-923(-)
MSARPARLPLLLAALWALACLQLRLDLAFGGDPGGRARHPGRGVEEVSASELEAALGLDGPVVLDVAAEWCGPCKLMEPILEVLQERLRPSGLRVLRMDNDDNPEKASELQVEALPTLIFFRDGAEVHRMEGAAGLEQLEALTRDVFGLDGSGPSASPSRAEPVSNAEELELAVQTEEAIVVGIITPGVSDIEVLQSSSTVESAMHLLQGRLRETGSDVRVLLVDAEALPETLAGLGAREVPSVMVFREGEQVVMADASASLDELVTAAGKALGMKL